MTINEVQAIDVHAHYGTYRQAGREWAGDFMSGGPEVVLDRAHKARTRLTVVSPLTGLLPRGKADSAAGNDEVLRTIPNYPGLRFWALVDPTVLKTFDQAADMLQHSACLGIKIHPEEHVYPIRDHGRKIFEFAARHHAVVSTHSGEPNSLPADYLPFADKFAEVTLILCHLGCGHDGDPSHQVRAVRASKCGNVLTDTSSMSSLMAGLIEWAVRQIGADHILYGTDSPLYFAPSQRVRIDHADVTDADKHAILCKNAERLFGKKVSP